MMKVGSKVRCNQTGHVWTVVGNCEVEEFVTLEAECGEVVEAAFGCFTNGMYTLVEE